MPRIFRRLARRALAAFTRLERLFTFRAKYGTPDRVRLGADPFQLEERVVPDGTQVTVAWLQDGGEPGSAGTLRFTRTAEQSVIDQNSLVVNFQVAGSATAGADYTLPQASQSAPPPGVTVSITFAPGQSVYDLSVSVQDDTSEEGSETVRAELWGGQGYTIGTAATAMVIISDDELWLETDANPVATGEVVTFWLPLEGPTFDSVEWDFDYDGTSFEPDADAGDDWFATTTFSTTGPRTIAARATTGGTSKIVTLSITVENPPPPDVTVPADMTVTVGTSVPLQASATTGSGIASVEWWFSYYSDDYEWEGFVLDPTITTLSTTYDFDWAGEYDIVIKVTDNDGKSGEGWFHVTVENATPTADITPPGPIDEGQVKTFTLWELDPDDLDTVTVYVDWTGTDQYWDQLGEGDFYLNAQGAVCFDHVYTASHPQTVYSTKIRVEDEWGFSTEYTADVTVRDVKPQATLTAGRHVTTLENNGQILLKPNGDELFNLWAISPGQTLTFTNFQIASAYDAAKITYHWKLDGTPQPDTTTPYISLPDYTGGRVYEVEAWFTDQGGTDSDHTKYTVATEGGGRAESGGPAMPGPAWGSVWIGEEGAVRDQYGRYHYIPVVFRLGDPTYPAPANTFWPENTPLTARITPDPATLAFAEAVGATIEYSFSVWIYDVERFSIGNPNHDLLYEEHVSTGTQPFYVVDHPEAMVKDRQIEVRPNITLTWGGQGFSSGCLGSIVAETPKTPTTWEQVIDTLAALRTLAQEFGDKADELIDALEERGVQHVFNVVTQGFTAALTQFVSDLPNTLKDKLFSWLLSQSGGTLTAFQNVNWSTADLDTGINFLMQYAGLTWDHVYQVVQQQLGDGNLAALEQAAAWFNNTNPSDPKSMTQFIGSLNLQGLDVNDLTNRIQIALQKKVQEALGKATVQLIAKFVPGAGVFMSLYNGLSWVLNNTQQITALFQQFLSCIDDLMQDEAVAVGLIKTKLLTALGNSVPMFMSMAASQLGLGNLPQDIKKALNFIPNEVDKALRKAVASIAGSVVPLIGGGTRGGLFDGRMAPERSFTYQGKNYVLWVAQDRDGTKVKIAERTGAGPNDFRYIGELNPQSFTAAGQASINDLILKTRQLHDASRATPQSGTAANPIANLKSKQDAVASAETAVVMAIKANACKVLNAGCFAAGTKLLTRSGWRAVETIEPGEEVLSRSEHDPLGTPEWKRVEEKFQRTGRILHLHVGNEVICTTPEHPFYVDGEGWTAAGALKEGDRVATLSGEWVMVEEVFDTELYEPVYNLRVEEYHTYFVGDETWGFAVWAHNNYKAGDVITRTVGGKTESVTLPPISMTHLKTLMVDGNKVRGFHILPTSVATITSTSPITLPAGSITVVDSNGTPIAGAQVKLTPSRVPADGYDAFEAKVEVFDSAGTLLASDASKSFYPQSWTEDQIQEAIYSAYAAHYRSGGTEFFARMVLRTPKGVEIEMRVSGSLTASGVRLREIPTAYLVPLQHLNSTHAP